MRKARLVVLGCAIALSAACHRHRARPNPAIDSTAKNTVDRDDYKDAGVSPPSACTNFYSYACDDWIDKTEIPDDEGMWTRSFQEVGKKNDEALRAILERDAFQPPADQPYSQELGDFYAACLDVTAIDARGDGELRALLDTVDTSDAEHAAATIAHLHLLGVPALFVLEPEADLTDSRKTNAVVRQPPLTLPEEVYDRGPDVPQLLNTYSTHLQTMFHMFAPEEAPLFEARATLSLETELATTFEPHAVFHDPSGAPAIIDATQLLQIAPNFPWKTYFSALGIEAPTATHVATPHYLSALNSIFARQMKTPTGKEELRTLLLWELVHALAPTLGTALSEENFEIEKSETGALRLGPRWQQCVRETEAVMGDALTTPFVAEDVSDETITRAGLTSSSIQSAMREEISKLPWMDDATRATAIEKIAQLKIEIAKAPAAPNYAGFKPDRTSYLGDLLRAREMATRRNLARIGRPTADTPRMSQAAANAYFDPRKNQLVLLAGILAPPILDADSISKNDATLGMILGHEMTHALDGRFDASGNLAQWWQGETPNQYRIRALCGQQNLDRALVTKEDTHLHGAHSIDERMADGGGLHVAYRALAEDEPAEGAKMKTRDQAFFTAFAQLWCAKFRPQAMQVYASTNAHPLPGARVNLAVSEMPEFAAAFSCNANDPMVQLAASHCDAW